MPPGTGPISRIATLTDAGVVMPEGFPKRSFRLFVQELHGLVTFVINNHDSIKEDYCGYRRFLRTPITQNPL